MKTMWNKLSAIVCSIGLLCTSVFATSAWAQQANDGPGVTWQQLSSE